VLDVLILSFVISNKKTYRYHCSKMTMRNYNLIVLYICIHIMGLDWRDCPLQIKYCIMEQISVCLILQVMVIHKVALSHLDIWKNMILDV
jgi:hypothetical protein